MSLLRSIRHQTSRRRLAMEALLFYIVAFVFIFLDLHFVRIKHYTPFFHREYLPVTTAAHQAMWWALIGPLVWVLQQNARPGDWWTSFFDLDWEVRRLVLAGVALVVVATLVAWRWMLPLLGLATAVELYLRFSRPKDSL